MVVKTRVPMSRIFVLKPPTQHYFDALPFARKVCCKSLTSKSSPSNTTNVFQKTGVFKSSNVKIQQTTSTPPVLSGFLVSAPSLNSFPWLPNIRPLPKSPRGHLLNHQRSPSQEPDSVDQTLETKVLRSFGFEKYLRLLMKKTMYFITWFEGPNFLLHELIGIWRLVLGRPYFSKIETFWSVIKQKTASSWGAKPCWYHLPITSSRTNLTAPPQKRRSLHDFDASQRKGVFAWWKLNCSNA